MNLPLITAYLQVNVPPDQCVRIVTPARPPQFAAQWEVSASCMRRLHGGHGRRNEKRALGELQIINNQLSCCSNSRIKPGRRAGVGVLQPSAWFPAATSLSSPQGTWGCRGHVVQGSVGAWVMPAGLGERPPAPRRCLLLLVRSRNLAGVVQPVPAPGPTGRKSLPACGGDSLAERAPPALLQIS